MFHLLLLIAFTQGQGYYYLDGVEIILKDGTVVKTISDLREDRFFYTWEEEGATVSVEKQKVRTIRYFSMRVKGKAPKKSVKNSLQRRISGISVAYERGGATYLKVMHVDARGRSAEGSPVSNRVKELKQSGQTDAEHQMTVYFKKTSDKTRARFRFYSLRGKLLCQTFVSMGKPDGRDKKAKTSWYNFTIPRSIDLKKLGLVEVFSENE